MPNPAPENIDRDFQSARKTYAQWGVDVDGALRILGDIPLSLHCWQADDVGGFENTAGLTGGGIRPRVTIPARRARRTSCAPTMRQPFP